MKILPKKRISKSRSQSRFDHQKDKTFKILAQICIDHGVQVRREELRAGPGWRANSGACRAQKDRLIFVDRRLPQDDQLYFLAATVAELRLPVSEEELAKLPEHTRELLQQLISGATNAVAVSAAA